MTEGLFSEPADEAVTESGPLNKAGAASLLTRAGHDYQAVENILAATSACGMTGKPQAIGPHSVLFLHTTGRWYIEGPSPEEMLRRADEAAAADDDLEDEASNWPGVRQAFRNYEARWPSLVLDIAASRLVTDAQAGGRIRALLFPQHIHDDDGTVEGCPGCFPPGEISRNDPRPYPGWHEPWNEGDQAPEPGQAFMPWPDLSREYDVSEILAAIRVVDYHLDAAAPEIYRGDHPACKLANRWRRIAAGPVSEAVESADALNLASGGNPRKGVVGDDDTVLGELGDTASSALLAIQSITKDTDATWAVFIAALSKALSRVPQPRPAPSTTTEGDTSS
jgi:hypothetical protein